MGLCCSSPDRVLPEPPADGNERQQFEELLRESLEKGNSFGWKIKKDWPSKYRELGFKMQVALKPHGSGNSNMLLRADGKYKGVTPDDFLGYLLNPVNLPGLIEIRDVETLPDGCIKFVRVKAPGMTERDHCWRYTVQKEDDGSIFVCIRTTTHDECPVKPGVIRAYYYNASLFKMSSDEEGVMEMVEFIFQDLKGSLPTCLMNAALPAGTIAANDIEMKHFKEKKSE